MTSGNILYVLVSNEVDHSELNKYDHVIAGDLSAKIKYGLEFAITDYISDIDKKKLLSLVDTSIVNYGLSNREIAEHIPIFSHIFYYELLYFDHYYSKLKKHISILPSKISKIVVSSDTDFVLKEALNQLSIDMSLEINFQTNKFSTTYGYFPLIDIIDYELFPDFDFFNFSIILSFWMRIKNIFNKSYIYYENYNNIDIKNKKIRIRHFQIFEYFKRKYLFKKSLFSPKKYYKNQSKFENYEIINYFLSCGFSVNQSRIIGILIKYICKEYSLEKINFLEKRIEKYLLMIRAKAIVVNDNLAISSRIFIRVANKLNIRTMYLPHGVLNYDRIQNGLGKYKIDFFLAWTPYALEKYNSHGISAKQYMHPHLLNCLGKGNSSNSINAQHKKKKILVLASSGDYDLPDEYMRDVYDIYNLFQCEFEINPEFRLRKIGVTGDNEFNYLKYVYQLCEAKNIQLKECDYSKSLMEIVEEYQFIVICGFTTAIIELISFEIPFVIYSRLFIDIDHADINKLPVVNDLQKLSYFYKFSNYNKYNKYLYGLKKELLEYYIDESYHNDDKYIS